MALGHHIIMRLEDDRVIAPDTASQRLLAKTVFRAARSFRLTVFRCADNHIHAQLAEQLARAMELARRIEIALSLVLGLDVPFQRARARPIANQWHFSSTFHYILNQERHHGTALDDFFEASNLPDLLGMRLIEPDAARHVRSLLPRVTRDELLGHLGGPAIDFAPKCLDDVADSAAAAFALPTLASRSRDSTRARAAAFGAARGLGSSNQLAAAIGVSERTVRRMRTDAGERTSDAAAIRAVELQMGLRSARRARRAA